MTVDWRKCIINTGVLELKSFGFHGVTEENIMHHPVYTQFFLIGLKESLGIYPDMDIETQKLMDEIIQNGVSVL